MEVSKGNLLEENHYYPHGLPIQPLSSVSTGFSENRRKYQGNEYIKDLGLNWMDFQARQYDPQIGRFLAVDPLADAGGQQVWSPYAAMGNAPESNVDPNGELPNYFNTVNWLPQIPGFIIRSGGSQANAPGGMAGWMMDLNTQMMNNSYFLDKIMGYNIAAGETEAQLQSEGYITHMEGQSISYYKWVQNSDGSLTQVGGNTLVEASTSGFFGGGVNWVSDFVQGSINSVVLTITSITTPVINQAAIIAREGPHEGTPRDPRSRVSWAVPYKFKDWHFYPAKSLMTAGDLSKEQGLEVMDATANTVSNTFGVYGLFKGPAFYFFNFGNPGVNKVADFATSTFIKEAYKKTYNHD
ncbi:RHS repeat domain-containing protein [Taibaiella helva]|uniref:RHS repeat domain-containing protein n=1 Tax=Taibaiella helva TaxID=2301235 RepID=UPI0013001DE8|nr:RHS repeat-associated core domain-containing protein [Taibaiella helva]